MSRSGKHALGELLVGSLLNTSAKRYPDREAIYCADTGRRFTFRELNERSNRLAHALIGLCPQPGTVVAFLCSNRAEIVEIYFALAKSGIVGMPLNYRLAPAEIAELINSMGATVLVCDEAFSVACQYIHTHVPGIGRTLWIGNTPPQNCLAYEILLAASAANEPAIEVSESDPYYFNLTSGTTGLPKSYILTQYNVVALDAALLAFHMRPDDVILTVFPAFGRVAVGWLMISIMLGTRNVLMNFDAGKVVDVVRQESVTFTNLVPTMASLMLASPTLDMHALVSLRAIAFVGSMLPQAIREKTMARLCPRLYEGYGLQEVGWITVSSPVDRASKPDSLGLPVLFSEVRVIDSGGVDVATGETGEIIGRAPNGIVEYFDNPARSAEAFRDGWFHTGDLGRLDRDGFLYISGRVKDMIISGGQNVHSAEIEATLLEIPGIADCAVIGLPDDTWGERVTGVIVATEKPPTEQQIRDYCRERLAGFKVPKQIFFHPQPLPRTPTGKVQKFILVESYQYHD